VLIRATGSLSWPGGNCGKGEGGRGEQPARAGACHPDSFLDRGFHDQACGRSYRSADFTPEAGSARIPTAIDPAGTRAVVGSDVILG
jgi:hypothetical protein